MDNRLDWRHNTDAVYKKGQSRLYFLRKLRSFSVCSKMLHIFYKSVVERAIIKKAGSVLEPLKLMVQRTILYEMNNIMDNSENPLHNTVIQQQCLQSEASSDLLQHRPLQKIFAEHSNNHLQ